MENNQQLATTGTKAVSQFLNQSNVLQKFADLLGTKAQGFIASVITIVNSNDKLKNATNESIYSAALMAATLDLPLNQSLGFAYIVPYNNTKLKKQEAQFQLGWRGFVQLAQRSGQYKNIAAVPIFKGQIVSENPLTGYEFDFTVQSNEVIGFASYFRLINGFEKTLYMTKEQVNEHAKKYSQSYNSKEDWIVKQSRWSVDFESMALKTVIKLLISKFGPMSIEMQKAQIADQGIIRDVDTMQVEYVDNTIVLDAEQIQLQLSEAKTNSEVTALYNKLDEMQKVDFDLMFIEKTNEIKASMTPNKTDMP